MDYEALATRAIDDPDDRELCDALLVCADELSQHGDPRGELLALELALRDASRAPGARVAELQAAIDAHVVAHAPVLLGPIGAVPGIHCALTLEWRGGQLYGVHLDARHVTRNTGLSAAELVSRLVGDDASKNLRRLRVRVRKFGHAGDVLGALADGGCRPLEELEIGGDIRPRGFGSWKPQLARRSTPAVPGPEHEAFDNLHFCALTGLIRPLPLAGAPELVTRIAHANPPTTRDDRILLGRALTSELPALRTAALRRVGELGGAARVFLRILTLMAGPNVVPVPLEVIACLRALGGHAREALPVLANVTSRSEHYDLATRRIAGAAVSALRAQPAGGTQGAPV